MALSHLKLKSLHHGRSLSLPSGSRPAISQFDENLSRVSASEAAYSSVSSLNGMIDDLKNLYDDLLLFPHNQQIISQEYEEKYVEQILDEYTRILDACSTVKDLVSIIKQEVRELLSAVRRKDVNGIHSYLTSRRKSKKMIQKSLKNLRSLRSKDNTLSLERDNETMALVHMLKDAESVTFSALESLLSYVMGTKVQERKSNWSLVSKLISPKKVSNEADGTSFNVFQKLDLFLLLSQEKDTEAEELVNHLKDIDSSIQILEEELEFLFRQLIKIRVFLLNVLNH